jgi:hypothetical protein
MENNTRASALFLIYRPSLNREGVFAATLPAIYWGHRTEPPESLIGRASRASPALAPIDQEAAQPKMNS